ncbi:OsmC family peroxiredoxin [Georgenia halophila]|uniref:OsmC family peroxiredoxin n=1 Tax=Georgenia halophila TaxID=620889 RepID=A0ABP8L467_9MICO
MPNPIVSKASTTWNGDLFGGSGSTRLDSSGLATFDVAWKNRAESHDGGTSPEELIAAAHATCFSMALAKELNDNGTPPTQLDTSAEVTFVAGEGITGIVLRCDAQVPDISAEDFQSIADTAKTGCPTSQALQAVPITLDAKLV